MSTGELIKEYRLSKKMSQKKLGEKLGVSQQQIAQYECGTRVPKLDTIVKIANALDIDINELLDIDRLHPIDYTTAIFDYDYLRYHEIKSLYDQLNDLGKKEAIKRIDELTQIDKYKASTE